MTKPPARTALSGDPSRSVSEAGVKQECAAPAEAARKGLAVSDIKPQDGSSRNLRSKYPGSCCNASHCLNQIPALRREAAWPG